MSKYSNKFKLKVVKYAKENGYRATARRFNIPSWSTVQKWYRKYELNGYEGLLKNVNSSYDGKFKQNVVEYMHNNQLSALETAIYFNLAGPNSVLKWEKIYYEKGPQALYEERRGRNRKNMNTKTGKNKIAKETKEDLIAENQRLRMENEYLKKLNALVQERIKRESKKR